MQNYLPAPRSLLSRLFLLNIGSAINRGGLTRAGTQLLIPFSLSVSVSVSFLTAPGFLLLRYRYVSKQSIPTHVLSEPLACRCQNK
ncbi:hypothetical protein LZ30DRAFT_702834 [Colletotrichum cereale]|nr:hypothetical protein LZ30DRAFT_702834 [Colletotrichum cereale]